MNEHTKNLIIGGIKGMGILFLIYMAISVTAYRFRHPDRTETQLFLEIPDALMWR